jgi:hypothetical protein
MKKRLLFLFMSIVLAMTAFSQETPQIAFRLLTDYLDNEASKQADARRSAGTFGIILGSTMLLSGGAVFIWGDQVAKLAHYDDWNDTTKYIISGSLVGTGLLTIGMGSNSLTSSPKDERMTKFGFVYRERDPIVQEAMAAAALKDLAVRGKTERVTSGFMDLAVPLASAAATCISNVASKKPWYDNLLNVTSWQIWSVASAINSLFFKKSNGELLYEKYLAANQALYGVRN